MISVRITFLLMRYVYQVRPYHIIFFILFFFFSLTINSQQTIRGSSISKYYNHSYYSALSNALIYFQSLQNSNWEIIPVSFKSKQDSLAYLPIIEKRLQLLRYLPNDSLNREVTDSAFSQAISIFQKCHGIDTTANLNEETLAALNISPYERSKQIAFSINQYISGEAICNSNYIMVNIPEQILRVIENDSIVLEMKVSLGKKSTPTPELSSQINKVILNPTWNVPQSIISNEIFPDLKKDKEYLNKHHMQVYEGWGTNSQLVDVTSIHFNKPEKYRIVQLPGTWNALGKIKFMIENDYDVYLHDTPEKSLFIKSKRYFSHGCVRLEKPFELATYLFDNDTLWKKMLSSADRDSPIALEVQHPLPVYIKYFTVWADANGFLHFRKDIYDHYLKYAYPVEEKETFFKAALDHE